MTRGDNFRIALNVYAPAIKDAIKGGDLREMKALLGQAKKIQAEQGNLPKAMNDLEKAIRKLEHSKK